MEVSDKQFEQSKPRNWHVQPCKNFTVHILTSHASTGKESNIPPYKNSNTARKRKVEKALKKTLPTRMCLGLWYFRVLSYRGILNPSTNSQHLPACFTDHTAQGALNYL